jgi:hypothetical protein
MPAGVLLFNSLAGHESNVCEAVLGSAFRDVVIELDLQPVQF